MSSAALGSSASAPGFPDFFDAAPTITLRDPLAGFLGSVTGGVLRYGYADAVRLAGHSCPTVAGAYLMTLTGLRALYGDDMPMRGDVLVAMSAPRDAGTTGVMATVAQLITGAAAETGFGGIAGRFDRRNLLRYDVPVEGIMGLRRVDNGDGVALGLNTSVIPFPTEMEALMPKAVRGQADEADLQRFGELWQSRVRWMLVEHADDPDLVHVANWEA